MSSTTPLKIGVRDYLLCGSLTSLLPTLTREAEEEQNWRLEQTEALKRRDAILQAVGFTAEQLLLAENWETSGSLVLESLGTAAEALGAHLYQNLENGGSIASALLRLDWSRNPLDLKNTYTMPRQIMWHLDEIHDLRHELSQGRPIQVPLDKLVQKGSTPMKPALLLVPVHVNRNWWGTLVFSTSETQRSWSEGEAEALKAGAAVLGASVQRLRGEAALRESEERYRRLAECAPDLLYRFRFEPSPTFEYVSPAIREITGHTSEEFCRNPQLGIRTIHPEDRHFFHSIRGTTRSTLGPVVLRWLHADGSTRWTEHRIVPIHDQTGRVVALEGIARDITERKYLEEQLRQAQKMEAVGRLAGGIAHDFNNTLAVINGYSELLLAREDLCEATSRSLSEIRKAGERAASLTRQLLIFSRHETPKPQILCLNSVIANVERMLERLIGEDVHLSTQLEPNLATIYSDPGQLEQILMNLAVNARDAMPQGGELTLETRTVELDEAYARLHAGVRPGPYVLLSVRDTGCGMDSITLSRIFEPFFTTKERGKGTGLGLAIVYGIVRQNDGRIEVESKPGSGTEFRVYLPAIEGIQEPAPAEAPSFRPPAGSETILLVEDEPAVRQLVREFLQRAGYLVHEAVNAREAVQLVEQHAGEIDMLITDVVMPGVSGLQLHQRLSERTPNLKVLYMSGYADETVLRHGISDKGVDLIEKPFTADQLLHRVRDILEG